MTPRARLVALVAALALTGCERMRPRVCDAAGLEEAAELLRGADARAGLSIDWSAEAIDRFARACPSVHPELLESLRRDYAGLVEDRRTAALGGSEVFWRERDRMCADLRAWASQVAYVESSAREELMFSACELERFKLLEGDERFSYDDLTGFVVHSWMVRNGVDEELARGFTRGLMTATAREPVVARRCALGVGDLACTTLARRRGVELPRSDGVNDKLSGVHVTASPALLRLGELTIPLRAGALPPDAVDNHVIEALVPALRGDAAARSRTRDAGELLTLALDRQTPPRTLIDLMYTAHQAGAEGFALLAANENHEDRSLALFSPQLWSEDDAAPPRDAATLRLTRASRELSYRDEPIPLDWDDPASVEKKLHDYNQLFPRLHAVDVQVADDVPLQRLVATLDLLRGSSCRFARYDEMPSDCYLWAPTLAGLEPIPRRPGDWDRLALSIKRQEWIRDETPRRKAQHEARLRARVEDALPAIKTCLLEHRGARALRPAELAVLFRVDAETPGVFVFPVPDARAVPDECVAAALELELYSLSDFEGPHLQIELTIEQPPARQPSL